MASTKKNKETVSSRDIAKFTLVILAVLATATFFWTIKDALLVAFAGVIFAIVINGLSRILRRIIPVSRNWSIVSVGVIILLLAASFVYVFGSQIAEEFRGLTERLPEKIAELQESIREWPMGEELLDGESNDQEENGAENDEENNGLSNELSNQAGGIALQVGVTIVDVLATLGLIVFIGIYFVIDPDLYKNGVALLCTQKRHDRIIEAMETSGNALWHWLSGQFFAMVFVGVVVTIGLMIIGVPLALVLGIIAGITEFVPIIGPWIGAVPGIILALSEGTDTALYTAGLYLIVQQIESNILTPLIQRHMVYIPPAIAILSVVAFGLIFGIAGIILAAPLAVIAMVFIGMFYVQDVLGKDVKIPGKD